MLIDLLGIASARQMHSIFLPMNIISFLLCLFTGTISILSLKTTYYGFMLAYCVKFLVEIAILSIILFIRSKQISSDNNYN